MLRPARPAASPVAALVLVLLAAASPAAGEDVAARTFRYLPTDTLYANAVRFESAAASFETLSGALELFQEEKDRAEFRKGLRESREKLGVDLETDVLPLIVGDFTVGIGIGVADIMMLSGNDATAPVVEQALSRLLAAFGCRDAEAFDRVIRTMARKTELEMTPLSRLNGFRIHLGGEDEPSLYYTHHEGRVLLALAESSLEAAIERHGSTLNLASSRDFRDVRGHVPESVESLTYVNLPRLAEHLRAFASMAAAGEPKMAHLIGGLLSPDSAPFGLVLATSKEGDGLKRTSYGPNTLLSQLPVQMLSQSMPVVLAIAVPNFLNAVGRGKQKRAMADMRTIGTAVESFAVDTNRYPVANGSVGGLGQVVGLREHLEPTYIKRLPDEDPWGGAFVYRVNAERTEYSIRCFGADGLKTETPEGETTSPEQDIIFDTGSFVSWPKTK